MRDHLFTRCPRVLPVVAKVVPLAMLGDRRLGTGAGLDERCRRGADLDGRVATGARRRRLLARGDSDVTHRLHRADV